MRTAVAQEPELFVYLGDNIYGDTKDMTELAAKYAQLGARPEFAGLRAKVPLIATWDDHDYGWNDAGKEYAFKEPSKEIFLEFWRELEDSPRRKRPGIYTSHLFGKSDKGARLQIILLDTRTFRDSLVRSRLPSWKNSYIPNPDPEKTFLGKAQWQWLEEQLRVPAEFRIIGSSIQFAHEYNGWESWTNLPHELYRMVDLIKKTRAEGVLFMSGDVHWGELSILPVKGAYPLHDLTASGINQDWPDVEPNRNRFGEVYRKYHFGGLQFDWDAEDPTVTLRIHGMDGAVHVEKTVKRSELIFPIKEGKP